MEQPKIHRIPPGYDEFNCSCGSFLFGPKTSQFGKDVFRAKRWDHMSRGHTEISFSEWKQRFGPQSLATIDPHGSK